MAVNKVYPPNLDKNLPNNCTQEEYEEIHRALDKTRTNSKFVKVDKKSLINLLLDHTELWQREVL